LNERRTTQDQIYKKLSGNEINIKIHVKIKRGIRMSNVECEVSVIVMFLQGRDHNK